MQHFAPETEVFIQFPSAVPVRVLLPAKVKAQEGDAILVQLAEPDAAPAVPETGASVTFYFQGSEFMQQPAEIVPTTEGVPGDGIALRPIGEPVSAESRQCYRVCTVFADYEGTFDGWPGRRIVDVSAQGLAFLSEQSHNFGDEITARLNVGSFVFEGRGFIQSIKEVKAGHRYGVLCADASSGNLARGLGQLTMQAQRAQLRRISGAA